MFYKKNVEVANATEALAAIKSFLVSAGWVSDASYVNATKALFRSSTAPYCYFWITLTDAVIAVGLAGVGAVTGSNGFGSGVPTESYFAVSSKAGLTVSGKCLLSLFATGERAVVVMNTGNNAETLYFGRYTPAAAGEVHPQVVACSNGRTFPEVALRKDNLGLTQVAENTFGGVHPIPDATSPIPVFDGDATQVFALPMSLVFSNYNRGQIAKLVDSSNEGILRGSNLIPAWTDVQIGVANYHAIPCLEYEAVLLVGPLTTEVA